MTQKSDVPILIVNGENDPATPPADIRRQPFVVKFDGG
jgi:hypothetical protein